jgi:Short C-terminal domain
MGPSRSTPSAPAATISAMFRKLLGDTSKLESQLRERGRRAPAEVLECSVSATISDGSNLAMAVQAVCKLRLRVEPPGEPPFEGELKQRFGQFAIPAPGSRVEVLYDPDDRGKLVVESASVAALQAEGVPVAELMQRAVSDPTKFRDEMLGHAGPAPEPADPLAQLERLAALRQRGALTAEEFEAQKKRLLGS